MAERSIAFSTPQRSMSMQEYIDSLDQITRRNTGSRVLQGEDINERALPLPYIGRFNQNQVQGNAAQPPIAYFSSGSPLQIPQLPVYDPGPYTATPSWLQEYARLFGLNSINNQTNAMEVPLGVNEDGERVDENGNIHYPNGNIRLPNGQLIDPSGRPLSDAEATRQRVIQGREEIADLRAEADRIQNEDPERAARIREATQAAEQALVPLERNVTRLENVEGRMGATQSSINALQDYINYQNTGTIDGRSASAGVSAQSKYAGLTDAQISQLPPQEQILARLERSVSTRTRDELRAMGVDLPQNYSEQVDELNSLVNQRNDVANRLMNEHEARWAYEDTHGGSSEGFYYDGATGRWGDVRTDFPGQFSQDTGSGTNSIIPNRTYAQAPINYSQVQTIRSTQDQPTTTQSQSGNQNLGERLSSYIESTQPTGSNFDLGISEALRGDFSGAANIAKNTITQGMNKIGDAVSGFASAINPFSPPKAQAAELAQPGQGTSRAIQNAQEYYQGGGAPSYTSQLVKREVGDSSSGAQTGTIIPYAPASPDMLQNTVADNRDPFFKAGGATTYADLINVGNDYRGALTPNLFKDGFYQTAQNVADVFGNSAYGQEATSRFKASEAAKYPTMNYGSIDNDAYNSDGNYHSAVNEYRSLVDTYNDNIRN